MATTIPVWQTPRLQYTVETNVTATDFERIEGNILNLRNTGKPFAITAGDNNIYSATITDIPTLVEGIGIRLKIHKTNTAQAYLNLNNLGNVEILKNDLQPTVANDLRAGQLIDISYIGGKWQLVGATQFVPVANADDIYQRIFHSGVARYIAENRYTLTVPDLYLQDGITRLLLTFEVANTNATTLTLNDIEIPIKYPAGQNSNTLSANMLVVNKPYLLLYRNGVLEILTHLPVIYNSYAQLRALKAEKRLVPGTQYVLTDYRTKYRQPDTNVIKEMNVEELVLTASSTSTFEPIVSSKTYPNDTIWYDFDNAVCEDTTTPRNGFILRRYDSISGNDCPQDWRSMLWARYKPSSVYYQNGTNSYGYSTWTSGKPNLDAIYKSGNSLYVAKNTNIPANATDSAVFEMVYRDVNVGMLTEEKTKVNSYGTAKLELKKGELHERLTFGEGCVLNSIGNVNAPHNNVFGNSCNKNTFGNGCYANTFGHDCYGNSFENIVCRNIFIDNCLGNSFGNECFNNTIGYNCTHNNFGNRCNNNIFGKDCYRNHFENECFNNTIGYNCCSNHFGIFCHDNSFQSDCQYNHFGNGCTSNKFGASAISNTFGNDCDNNTFGNVFKYNHISDDCNSNKFGNNVQYNYINTYCSGNTFGDNKVRLFIKLLYNKDITNVTALANATYTLTIEQSSSGGYIYWYIDGGGMNIIARQIP